MPTPAEDCARNILDTIPLVMREIRAQMRSHRGLDLSVPQFRALAFIRREPEASLSRVAQHVGTALPSMSKLVDGLVERSLVERRPSVVVRRRVALSLTPGGTSLLEAARRETQTYLEGILSRLSQEEWATVKKAMAILSRLFTKEEGT
jgi:DNA-binding MarR family transcriptional regulator